LEIEQISGIHAIRTTKNFVMNGRILTVPMVILFTLCFLSSENLLIAQLRSVSLAEAIDMAVANNKDLEVYRLRVTQSRKLKAEAFDPGATGIYYGYDENNLAANDLPLKILGIEQSFDFPTVYVYRLKAARTQADLEGIIYELQKDQLIKKVAQNYYHVMVAQKKLHYLKELDSLYSSFISAADRRYRVGESNYLESLTSRAHALLFRTRYIQMTEELTTELQKLQSLIQSDTLITVPDQDLQPLEITTPDLNEHYGIMLHNEMQKLSQSKLNIEKNLLLPGFKLEYFQGTNNGENAKIYPGFQIGVSVPILFGAQNARIQAARIEKEISSANALNYASMLKSRSEELNSEIRKYNEVIKQYQVLGKETAAEIMKYARYAYDQGEIDFFKYIYALEEAVNIELDYLENLRMYNQAVLELNYLNL